MEINARIELPLLMKYLGLPMIAVEVGVAGASFSTDLLKHGIEKIYCVDAWATIDVKGDGSWPQDFHNANYHEALFNLSQFDRSRYVILQGKSNQVCHLIPDEYLGLIYLDADHFYFSVKEDIECYYPKLVAGGVMAFHDYANLGYGVKQAVTEFASAKNLEIHIIPETGVGDQGCYVVI